MNDDNRIASILFIDLVGSSEIASIESTNNYVKKYVQQFQQTVNELFEDEKFTEKKRGNSIKDDPFVDFHVRGDEGFYIIARKNGIKQSEKYKIDNEIRSKVESDILTLFKIALRIKYKWLLNEINFDRLKEIKQPYDIAIGINTGIVKIVKDKNKKGNKNRIDTAEGYAINLAKRIEGISRSGEYSGIFISEHTFGYYNDIGGENLLRFKKQSKSELKGISGFVQNYELIFANLDEDDEIVNIPEEWLGKKLNPNVDKKIKAVEKYFKDTLNPWLGNVLANIKWRRGISLLESVNDIKDKSERVICFEEIEKLIRDATEISRKLIEIDPTNAVWKNYLVQILFDYLYDNLELYHSELVDKKAYRKLIIKHTIEMLRVLVNNEPHELDGRLYFGKYYLEIDNIIESLNDPKCENKEEVLKKALEQFQLISIWDDKYPDAYYYQAGTKLQLIKNKEKNEFEEEKKEINKLLMKGIKIAGLRLGDKMKKHARKDDLFKPLWKDIDFLKVTKIDYKIENTGLK